MKTQLTPKTEEVTVFAELEKELQVEELEERLELAQSDDEPPKLPPPFIT